MICDHQLVLRTFISCGLEMKMDPEANQISIVSWSLGLNGLEGLYCQLAPIFLSFYMCPIICLTYVQVFLTLCTLVTLYFAREVPLITSESHRLSDSAPLLDDTQQNGLELSKSKSDNSNGNINKGIEQNVNPKHGIANANSIEDQNESLGDGPGAVLVNLLTSLRHLPPGMHSVLVVMALTWVSIL